MMRVVKWLFILLAVIAALVVALLFSKDAVARAAVEQQLQAATAADVKLGKLSLRLFSPVATMENLTLANPADFGGVSFLNIREMRVEYDREALLHREVKITLLKLNIAELTVVRNDRGETNLVVFAAAPKPAKNSDNFDFKGIAVANFSVSKVNFVDLKNQRNNRQFNWNVQNHVFRNLNSAGEFNQALLQLWQQRR
jgi:uncharacterized protein involved in outer membrane biogenesis